MGIRKRHWYTVECNCCGSVLEDYAGDIAGLTNTKNQAKDLAIEYGWELKGKDTWICPECIAKDM